MINIDDFERLAGVYGLAPSQTLREFADAVAVLAERDSGQMMHRRLRELIVENEQLRQMLKSELET